MFTYIDTTCLFIINSDYKLFRILKKKTQTTYSYNQIQNPLELHPHSCAQCIFVVSWVAPPPRTPSSSPARHPDRLAVPSFQYCAAGKWFTLLDFPTKKQICLTTMSMVSMRQNRSISFSSICRQAGGKKGVTFCMWLCGISWEPPVFRKVGY